MFAQIAMGTERGPEGLLCPQPGHMGQSPASRDDRDSEGGREAPLGGEGQESRLRRGHFSDFVVLSPSRKRNQEGKHTLNMKGGWGPPPGPAL